MLLAGLSVLGLALFILVEAKAAEPLMPLEIWRSSLITVANLATLSTGIIIMGLSSFLPTFIQGVMGQSPMMAGFALASMSLGWPLASMVSGKLLLRFGTRTLAVAGGIFILFGTVLLVLLISQRGWWLAATGSFLVGVGMGLARTVFIVAIQNSVSWQQRGVVTASNMLMNILGSTLGAAVLGAVLNNRTEFLSKDYTSCSRTQSGYSQCSTGRKATRGFVRGCAFRNADRIGLSLALCFLGCGCSSYGELSFSNLLA
ncbi:hypothetical protein JCM15765_16740 [Paradesulfitobacterium aromaticivorans]